MKRKIPRAGMNRMAAFFSLIGRKLAHRLNRRTRHWNGKTKLVAVIAFTVIGSAYSFSCIMSGMRPAKNGKFNPIQLSEKVGLKLQPSAQDTSYITSSSRFIYHLDQLKASKDSSKVDSLFRARPGLADTIELIRNSFQDHQQTNK